MKEAANVSVKISVERERTKMRERLRRSITTNILHGLRKQGGYRLSPRADINEVLRHLAHEAGWIVDSDGTTYRNPNASNGNGVCRLCCGAGNFSATASPRRESAVSNLSSGSSAVATTDALLAVYMRGGSDAANREGQQELCFFREAGASNQNPPAGSP